MNNPKHFLLVQVFATAKTLPLAHYLFVQLWRLYLLFIFYCFSFIGICYQKRWIRVIKLRDFLSETNGLSVKVVFPIARSYEESKQQQQDINFRESSVTDILHCPPVYTSILQSASVVGGSSVIFVNRSAITHDLFECAYDYTSEELYGRFIIDTKKCRMQKVKRFKALAKIEVAATFLDACAPNYAHWITEVLPKIAVFCSIPDYNDIPIIINEGLHENIRESLRVVVGDDRQVIELPLSATVEVGRLIVTSVVGYVPFQPRKRFGRINKRFDGAFSADALQTLRHLVHERLCAFKKNHSSSKFYFCRTSASRKLLNNVEVERKYLEKGYQAINTETLSFADQASLAMNAECIVSPTGAALANCIFCNENTSVTVLMANHKDMIYGYWPNIFSTINLRPKLILGTIQSRRFAGLHADYFIDTSGL